MANCVFCEKPLSDGPTVTLGAKGCDGIAKASLERESEMVVKPGEIVHVKCRKVFCNSLEIQMFKRKRASEGSSHPANSTRTLRSENPTFSYQDHCLFCGRTDKYDGKKKMHELIPVRTMEFDRALLRTCDERQDEWSEKVKGRVVFAQDLHAADAVYHQTCSVNFRTGKQIPHARIRESDNFAKRLRLGRPEDAERADAFLKVAEYLEANDEEQTTVNNLIQNMADALHGSGLQPYGFTHMKEKLLSHFGDKIIITEINGTHNVVTFRCTASAILNEFYRQPKESDHETEKLRLIETASNLIKSDIKSVVQSKDIYPTSLSMSNIGEGTSFLPESLRLLLSILFVGTDKDLKLCTLGQAIMQATRPRILIAPLQLGLGVQMHSHFASRFLIDTLNAHGYCSSYSEVQRYERCATMNQGLDISEFFPGQFMQYVADNVDHDIRTLDGCGTFHGMGIIAAVTPKHDVASVVKRASVSASEIAAVGHISIKPFTSSCTSGSGRWESIKYESLKTSPDIHRKSMVDLLWETSLLLRCPRPAWSGYMQLISKGNHPGQASVMFLPMIDMNPSDMTCVNSTLHFVSEHARRHGVTPVLTFDQPLWWKAMTIVESAPENSPVYSVVVRLGGFHTLMSFLGSIGHLMAGTGLQEILEVIFAGNTVSHILSGKAVARALRGHFLIDAVFHTLLLSRVFHTKLSLPSEDNTADEKDVEMEGDIVPEELEAIADLYDKLVSGKATVQEVESSMELKALERKLQGEIETMVTKNLTAKLWIKYMEMIDITRTFIRSERTGDWFLHLKTMQEMLPYLAASGHNLYTKSLHLYLQKMTQLEETHPHVYMQFTQGLHVVRRSDRFWAGLSTDLVIEQVLMRSLKTSGGLTRGRGMTETQRLIWCLSRPTCAEVNIAMQQLTSVTYETSEQHKDLSQSRQTRDSDDSRKLFSFIEWRSPFDTTLSLQNIVSGIAAGARVNVDHADVVGEAILKDMVGNSLLKYSFKRKNQAITFESKAAVKIGNDVVQIDPLLLFQRLIITGSQANNLANALTYELCNYPPALFEGKDILLEAVKPQLANAIWSAVPPQAPPSQNFKYVLDGGALLHRIPWQVGDTYDKILQDYSNYVTKHYGQAVVVFDGYKAGPSTKDSTHQRRAECEGRKVVFNPSMKLQLKKKEFLSNKENKQRFLVMLGEKLSECGCEVAHAVGDADSLIVQSAVKVSRSCEVVLVGDDTDLLVLLIHLAVGIKHDIYFRPEPKKGAAPKCVGVKSARHLLGENVCKNVLFIHAFLGCDTTSRIFGIGKAVGLKHINESTLFRQQAEIFGRAQSPKNEVIAAGEKAMVILYRGSQNDHLDTMRHRRFQELVTISKKAIHPNMLPPTSAALKYHSLRVFYQVQQWKGNALEANDWGWKTSEGKMKPVHSDLDAAPQSLLELVRCTCKSGCGTLRCGCRRQGLECSSACSGCRGVCENMSDDLDDI